MIGAIEIFEIAHDDLEMSGMIVIYVSFYEAQEAMATHISRITTKQC